MGSKKSSGLYLTRSTASGEIKSSNTKRKKLIKIDFVAAILQAKSERIQKGELHLGESSNFGERRLSRYNSRAPIALWD